MRFRRPSRRALLTLLAGLSVGIAFVAVANHVILSRHKDQSYSRIDAVPYRDVALVLGANPRLKSGAPNLHFAHRIEAAAALYHAGKVRHLLVSGDNHRSDYDEPTAMKAALVARGVPAEAITCDYAGFRTLDSVARANSVFGLRTFTVVSQRYHTARALEIAHAHGLDAVAFCSSDVPAAQSIKTELREIIARADTWLDLYVWHRGPRFPGPPEPILIASR